MDNGTRRAKASTEQRLRWQLRRKAPALQQENLKAVATGHSPTWLPGTAANGEALTTAPTVKYATLPLSTQAPSEWAADFLMPAVLWPRDSCTGQAASKWCSRTKRRSPVKKKIFPLV